MSAKGKIVSPKSILLPYQRAWVDDHSRFKIGLWARQTGKDFSCAAEAVEDSLRVAKTQWTILATGERQALESVGQAKLWAESFGLQIEDYLEDRDNSEALIKSAEITWSNGSRLRALPANPATCRGLSTNLILTEFAFHEKPDEIWRAIYPSISNPLRGGQKKLRIISTPNGRGNKFGDLWTKNYQTPGEGTRPTGALYSCQKITIHDAVRLGLPLDIAELKAGLDDPEGWAQEYECEFIDSSAILLPYDLIQSCEHLEATTAVGDEWWAAPVMERTFLGIDFGRKKDKTVCWTFSQIGDVLWTVEVLELANMPTPQQVEILRPRVRRATRVCLDYTGPGVGLGDYLVQEAGEYSPEHHRFGKVELCQFSAALLCDVFPKTRMRFENHTVRIPVDRACREDLHAIQRVSTPGGKVTYKAPHNPAGHADRAYALALAVRAATFGAEPGRIVAFTNSRRSRVIASRRNREVLA